ncbi:hypothetical protein B0J14DRAFT_430731, partial [Halenospora varia]
CKTGFTLCSPKGATSTSAPQIGSSDFANLFNNLLSSSLPSSKRDVLPERDLSERATASLCCVTSLSCLTLANMALPFCYDRFTTNFLLPDGSYGTVATGSYTSSGGDTANLETGNYTLTNGQTGNIYSSNAAAKPNTATIVLPSQYTASGVGSAIPATALGGFVTLTYTTTLSASTVSATTVQPTTLPGSVVSSTIVSGQVISTSVGGSLVASTVSVTSTAILTVPASTVVGTTRVATTVAGAVSTVVTTSAVAAATTTKKSA